MATVNAAHVDNENQQFSILGVVGTLGTADTKGTAATLPIGVNPDNGAMYVDVMDTSFNVGTLTVGTINRVGTVSEVTNGSIVVTAGTIGKITPGTAATDLGKAKGNAVGATDTGVAVFGKISATDAHTSEDNGDYDTFSMTDYHELRTRDQRAIDLANCNVAADYTALSNDTTGIAISNNHVFGTAGLTFNKVNGSDNTIYGGVSKTLGSINVAEIFEAGGFVGLGAYLPALTNVINVFLRIGDDSTNYNCWTWPVADLTAATWLNLRKAAAGPDYSRSAGTGWNTNSLKYVAFGVEFNAESNTLSGMVFDHVHIVGGRVTSSDINAAITSSVTTPNVNVQRLNNNITATNNGASTDGALRVTVANDSTGVLARVGTLNAGTVTVGLGTINSGTINAGTINTGTINAGTINAGTVRLDARSTQNILTFGTTFGGTAAGYGTLVGSAGVGTSIWVNDLSVVNQSGTIGAMVGFGTALNGTSVLAKGKFAANGGIQKSYPKAVNAGMTNTDLVCYVDAAGTMDVNVSYFISA